jgi:hypothetical protein
MKLIFPLATLALAALPVLAGPINPDQISGQANWYVHADLDTLRGTEIGKTLMAAVEDEHGRKLKAVKRMFSLNPMTDLHGITLYGNGEKDKAVILINGIFDRAHVEDLIRASDGYKTSTHHEDTVHTWKDKEKTQHGAFFGDDLVIMSEHKMLVVHALEVLNGRKPSMDAGTFGTSPSAILLGFANLEGIDIKGDEAKLLEKARALRIRFFEQGERLHAELVIHAANNDDAVRIRKVLDGMVALGQLDNEDLEELGIELVTSVEEDTDVTARLSAPSRNLLKLVDQAGKLDKFMD